MRQSAIDSTFNFCPIIHHAFEVDMIDENDDIDDDEESYDDEDFDEDDFDDDDLDDDDLDDDDE